MKNITDVPNNIKFNDVLNDIDIYSDYTTFFNVNHKSDIDIFFKKSDIPINTINKVKNRIILSQDENDNTYKDIYSFYPEATSFINSVKQDDKKDYPLESQYVKSHTTGNIGVDGTFSTNSDTTNSTSIYSKQFQYYNRSYMFYQRFFNPDNIQSQKIINNELTIIDHKNRADYNWQNYNYSGGLSVPKQRRNYDDIDIENYEKIFLPESNLTAWEYSGIPFHYIIPNTSNTDRLLKQEMKYEFNEPKWINIIKGYLHTFRWESYFNYVAFNQMRLLGGEYFNTGINVNTTYPTYTSVMITAYGFDIECNDQIIMGHRECNNISIFDFEKMLPLIPKKISAIKVVIEQKFGASRPWGSVADSPYEYDRMCACSQFVPGFDVSVANDDEKSYVTKYDTRNFIQGKQLNTELPAINVLKKYTTIVNNKYDEYLSDVILTDSTNLQFKVNKNSYRHSMVIGEDSVSSISVELLKWDYLNYTDINDSTIVESYIIDDIDNIISINFINELTESTIIHIKILYNKQMEDVINTLLNLNVYSIYYNNFEYDLRLPEKTTYEKIVNMMTYEYDSTSSSIKEVTRWGNYCFVHKDIPEIILYNENNINAIIQVTQIGENGILEEKQFNNSGWLSNEPIDYTTNTLSFNDSTIIVPLSDLTILPDAKYLMVSVITNIIDQEHLYVTNNTPLTIFKFSYMLPYRMMNINIESIDEVESIIQNNNIVNYKLYYTKKV